MSGLPTPQKRIKSGAYAKGEKATERRCQKVRGIVRKLYRDMPMLQQADRYIAKAWAEHEVLARFLYDALKEAGPINAKGEGKRLLHDYRLIRASQLQVARELGLTPLARRAMRAGKGDDPIDLAAMLAAGEKSEPE
jgi:hypothetical protein